MCSFNIPNTALYIIDKLIDNNFDAYIVGGCVRDSIIGNVPNDYDICTSALPQQVKDIFSKTNKIYDTGLKHGTITINVNDDLYEVTTFRTESDYTDNRHPDKVSFVTDIKSDLSRRDFTCNAIAYNYADGFIDTFDGKKDIENKIIRCVGNANERFNEDALRILRAIRFACKYNFTIETETDKAIHNNKHLLNNISAERINLEFSQILLYADYDKLINYRDVFAVFIPEISETFDFEQHNKYHNLNVYNHIAKATAHADNNDLILKLTMFLHDIGKPSCFFTDGNGEGHFYDHPDVSANLSKTILQRLRFTNEQINKVVELVKLHDMTLPTTDKGIRKALSKYGYDTLIKLTEVKKCDNFAQSDFANNCGTAKNIDDFICLLNKQNDNSDCALTLKDLKVNGNDLISLGFAGRDIGIALNKLLDIVLDNPTKNDRDVLLNIANNLFNNVIDG